jgi:hypothetical protein
MGTDVAPEPISLGSCPTCGGPAQFIDARDDPTTHYETIVREVKLPNVDEDLGDHWRLRGIVEDSTRRGRRRWHAWASRPNPSGHAIHVTEGGDGTDPSAAYLALRTAIEARG